MPLTDVNLMWLGNTAILDRTPTTNITQTQANAINGWTAQGPDQLQPVSLSGNYYQTPDVNGPHFRTTYLATRQYPASEFSYISPSTGQPVSGVSIQTFVTANYQITVHDGAGNATIVNQSGVLMQMSNGDLFFRPALTTVDAWNGIDRISEVQITSVGVTNLHAATIGFNASIFDLTVVCFTRGTMIDCPEGPRPVEDLRVGDLVLTQDRGAQPIRWIGSRRLDAELAQAPHLLPIRIRAGALGDGLPAADLLVSPQHRILLRSRIAARMFGATEVLVAAKALLGLDGIEVASDQSEVEYFHFIFDQHEIVFANGAEAESLLPGPEALKAVGPAARRELADIFQGLDGVSFGPARDIIKGPRMRRLADRHVSHRKPLVSQHTN